MRAVTQQGQMSTFSPNAKRTDPATVIYQKVTRGMWDKLCQYTVEGVKLVDALKAIDIRESVYRSVMREDIASREQLEQARADWDNRNWPESLIETICIGIAMGERLINIADDEVFKVEAFHSLRLRDEYVNDKYMRAKRIMAEGMVDELIALSDDDTNDMAQDSKGGDKPNTAAVQRSRLKTDNRKWLASKLLKEIYGDVQTIEADINLVVDHAARLEDARNRKEEFARRAREAVDASVAAGGPIVAES